MPKKNPLPSDRGRLMGSKWSATAPVDREKHFRVVGVRSDRNGETSGLLIELEALISRRRREVQRDDLMDPERWRPGWR